MGLPPLTLPTLLQRAWLEQQAQTQGVHPVAWPQHIYEKCVVVVRSGSRGVCQQWFVV